MGTERILGLGLLNSGTRGGGELSSMIAERRKFFASKLMESRVRLRRRKMKRTRMAVSPMPIKLPTTPAAIAVTLTPEDGDTDVEAPEADTAAGEEEKGTEVVGTPVIFFAGVVAVFGVVVGLVIICVVLLVAMGLLVVVSG